MSVKKFLLSRIFFKNLGIAILVLFLLSWISMLALSIYTNRGRVIFTPNFSGMNISQVQNIADQKALRITVKDSVFRPRVAVGTVLMQNPLSGHKIKPGRMIYLTLASALPEKTEVPKATDVSLRQARVLLESKGFSVGNVEYQPSEFDGLVLEQKYKGQSVMPGTKLDNGTAIDLVVGGRGFGTETTVPSLVGLTFVQAKEQIHNKYLTAGAIIFEGTIQTSQDSMNAIVWKQLPEADSTKQINAGSAVDLWLKAANKDSINSIQ